jgi:NAD(P)-dependent dehydrogenase (short-subunit alcohol dehydrogenase family)
MRAETKVVLITGASRGLGRNMALRVAEKGMDVIITYRQEKDEAETVVAQIRAMGQTAHALQLDTGNIKAFDAFFGDLRTVLHDVFGKDKFDVLVNNAGIGIHSSITDTTEETFDSLMNIHFKGVFFLTQRALPLLKDGGSIINISTGLARFAGPGYSVYASMKAAIENLTRYEAKELGARKIRANVIAPGAIATDFGGGLVRDNPQYNNWVS